MVCDGNASQAGFVLDRPIRTKDGQEFKIGDTLYDPRFLYEYQGDYDNPPVTGFEIFEFKTRSDDFWIANGWLWHREKSGLERNHSVESWYKSHEAAKRKMLTMILEELNTLEKKVNLLSSFVKILTVPNVS